LRLLNVLERHLLISALITKDFCATHQQPLPNAVEVAAKDGNIGVVGVKGGLAELQGLLEGG